MADPKAMTEEEWITKFRPIKNPHVDDSSYGGTMFETYGAELESVRAADPACVWTLVQGEGDDDGDEDEDAESDCNDYILKGYHHINRMGYFITALPADDDAPDEIKIDF